MYVKFTQNPLKRGNRQYPCIGHDGIEKFADTKKEALKIVSQMYDDAAKKLYDQREKCLKSIESFYENQK